MALQPKDLSLGPEEIADLADLQKQIDLKLKQFGDFVPRPSASSLVSRSDHQIPLTFPHRPGQQVIETCQRIYRLLGWDVTTSIHKDALVIMIGPSQHQASDS